MCPARLSIPKLLLLLLALIACVGANAGLFGVGETSWQEEVLLHDGSKIIADRTIVRGRGNRGFTYQNQKISFALPATGESILWEDQFSQDLGDSNFLPMLLDIDQDVAYLVAKPMGCLSYNKWERPNPPYVVFKYQDKAWVRIPISNLPVEIKSPNLISSQPDTEVKQMGRHFIDAKTIQKFNSEYPQSHFRTILREPFSTASEGCFEMVPYGNGGWLGIDWFSDQPSREACSKFCDKKKVAPESCPCARLFKAASD